MLRKTVVGLLVFDGFFELKQLEGVGQLVPKKSDTYLNKRFTKNRCWHCYMAPMIAFHGLFVGWFAWAELEYVRLGSGEPISAGQSSWCHIRWGHDLIINGWWMDDKWMMNEVGLHLTQNSKSIETNLLLVAFLPQQRSTWDGSSNDGRFLYMKPLSFSHVTSCFH